MPSHIGRHTAANGPTKDKDILLPHLEYLVSKVVHQQSTLKQHLRPFLFISIETIAREIHGQHSHIEASSEQIQQVKSLAKVFCIRMEVQQKFAGALAAATAQRRCTTKGVGGALGHTVARDGGRVILGGEGEPELPKLSV